MSLTDTSGWAGHSLPQPFPEGEEVSNNVLLSQVSNRKALKKIFFSFISAELPRRLWFVAHPTLSIAASFQSRHGG